MSQTMRMKTIHRNTLTLLIEAEGISLLLVKSKCNDETKSLKILPGKKIQNCSNLNQRLRIK